VTCEVRSDDLDAGVGRMRLVLVALEVAVLKQFKCFRARPLERDVAIVDGVPVTTATPLPIVATGADVVEAVAASADCDETCEAVRAALADPPGSPAAVGEACDCFQILGIPPRRTRVGRHVVTGGKSGSAAGYCSSL